MHGTSEWFYINTTSLKEGVPQLTEKNDTSVMIYHCGASLSKQHTDLPIGHCTKQDLCRTSLHQR